MRCINLVLTLALTLQTVWRRLTTRSASVYDDESLLATRRHLQVALVTVRQSIRPAHLVRHLFNQR